MKVWLKNMAAACILCALLALSGVTVLAATVVQTDKTTADSGNILLGLEGSYIVDTENALNRINAIRLEACKEGVTNPSTGKALTEADYVPIRWSSDLEYIARIRAAESSLTMQHLRTNGKSCFSLCSPNGVQSWGEVLAWNWTQSVVAGINQWYEEKDDWVNSTGGVTGHYTAMIDPENLYVGLGTFYSEDAYFPNTTAGEFSSYSGLDETRSGGISDVIQVLEFQQQDITGYSISGETSGQAGDRLTMSLAASVNCGSYTAEGLLVMDAGVTWSSSNPSVAVVDSSGTVTVLHCGTTTITAQYGSASCSVSFTANHIAVTDEAVAATCTTPGKTEGSHCSVCNTVLTEQQETALKAHSGAWTTTAEATIYTAEQQARTCTVCGAQETRTKGSALKPTIKLTANSLKMQKGQTTTKFKVTAMANGDSLASVKSSNSKIVKVSKVKADGTFKLKALKVGTVKLTVKLKSGKSKTIKVTVQKSKVTTTKVSVTGVSTKVTLSKGKKLNIGKLVVIAPVTSQDKITYSTSNKKVASVSSSGVITAKKKGKATITVKCGKKTWKCTITVQ